MNFIQKVITREVDFLAKFYDRKYLLTIFNHNNHSPFSSFQAIDSSSSIKHESNTNNLIFINGDLNYINNIQEELQKLRSHLERPDRVAIVAYNSYLNWLYTFANSLRLRKFPSATNTLSKSSIQSIMKVSGFEIVKSKPLTFVPFSFFGLGNILNSLLFLISPLKDFSICHLFIVKPSMRTSLIEVPLEQKPKLSIIIPVRNEAGTIPTIFQQLSELKTIHYEAIFVEGNSTDKTWEVLHEFSSKFKQSFPHSILKQPSIGKRDAVDYGFTQASGEILTILDGDLTVPLHNLDKFYFAYLNGDADFINGNRLFYPFESEAMRTLNWFGNMFFAKTISYLFYDQVSDTLCGTKLFRKSDLKKFYHWAKHLGIQDPFGDYQLLMPALDIGIGAIDIPVHYKSRSYGQTNISRFKDGLILLKICLKALIKRKAALSF